MFNTEIFPSNSHFYCSEMQLGLERNLMFKQSLVVFFNHIQQFRITLWPSCPEKKFETRSFFSRLFFSPSLGPLVRSFTWNVQLALVSNPHRSAGTAHPVPEFLSKGCGLHGDGCSCWQQRNMQLFGGCWLCSFLGGITPHGAWFVSRFSHFTQAYS